MSLSRKRGSKARKNVVKQEDKLRQKIAISVIRFGFSPPTRILDFRIFPTYTVIRTYTVIKF